MPDWNPVHNSSRIVAEAYDEDAQEIYVRFPDGVEWWYGNCSRLVWEEFTAPGQSRGRYIHNVLDSKPNGRY